MAPAGPTDIDPAVTVVQTLAAVGQGGHWRIAIFQNTPAAYHGGPELSEQLTKELSEALQTTSPH